LDTGANVSVIGEKHRKDLQQPEIRPLSDLLDRPDQLEVQWGDQRELPYIQRLGRFDISAAE